MLQYVFCKHFCHVLERVWSEGVVTSVPHGVLRQVGKPTALHPWPTLGVFPWQLEVDHGSYANPA